MNSLKKLLFGCFSIFAMNTYAQCNNDYELSWADEFELSAVDETKWRVIDGGGGFGNQEIQYYKPENATVSDGLLHIKIANETVVDGSKTYNYTSAKLETASKATFTYGKMEARIKMPSAVGTWPAFWMLGSNIGSVGWPHCGEIDVMEWVGQGPNAASGSIFFDGIWPNNHITTRYFIPQGQSFTTEFHTFAVEWEPNEIRYYCDGNHYATYTNSTIAPKEWLFNHDFFLILNCAIGGTGGGPVVNIVEPEYMEVDYVRVYSLPTTASSITISGPTALLENSENVFYKTTYFPNTTYEWVLPTGATIVDGSGTNEIHVSFGAEGGDISVTATNTCTVLTESKTINLLANTCTIMYDNFDDIKNVTYDVTGTLDQQFANPSQDDINPSDFVAQYQRNIEENYDVFGINDIALENALDYESGNAVFFMDVYTSAPIGTSILLQLENGTLSAGDYPQGRRSSYAGVVSKQNEWHTVRFNFNQLINAATQPDQVDHIAILFNSGSLTGDIFYLDNFRRLRNGSECPAITTGSLYAENKNAISVYPNPATQTLFISNKNESETFSIYSRLGEKLLEKKGNEIDISQLSNGIYLFKTGTTTLKFVKQ